MIDLNILKLKNSVDPKLLQLKMWMRSKQKIRDSEEFPPIFNKITEQFSLLFAGDEIVVPKTIEKANCGRTTLRSPGLNKNASRRQYILVIRNEKGHQEEVQYMHCMHGFR